MPKYIRTYIHWLMFIFTFQRYINTTVKTNTTINNNINAKDNLYVILNFFQCPQFLILTISYHDVISYCFVLCLRHKVR